MVVATSEMTTNKPSPLDEIRKFYARLMAAASKSGDPRLERIFELVPREAFLPPGPWHVCVGGRYFETPSADPIYLYQNLLVALDASRGINNGEPFLHAAWIGAVEPKAGEAVCHIGSGMGYYTALLSMLVLPGGRVDAFEIDENFALAAHRNLIPFEGVQVLHGDATRLPLPPSDVIYVNAGISAPPAAWLEALLPGGRMIFPWRPSRDVGIALLVTCGEGGFEVKPLMSSWFIPCIGASADVAVKTPTAAEAWSARSIWPIARRRPDETAVAIYDDIWFSSSGLSARL
jgi:protein-L-isoaspartate(D-aspartate) O-methyltransferase